MRRRIKIVDGQQALLHVQGALKEGIDPDRDSIATAVRYLLEELGTKYPGRTLEVRVAPYGAVQCLEGPTHTRGTPPNVIEFDALVWIRLATGTLSWQEARADHLVQASGVRATLEGMLPL